MNSEIKRNPVSLCERALFLLLIFAWTACLATILAHPIFVTNDSVSDYAHVWYIAKVLWGGGGLPFHFSLVEHGAAMAYPYGFIAWTSAALLRPVLGDWVTTLWLVGGGLGVLSASVWAFPEVRRVRAMAMLLANPLMVEAVLLGQLPFLWATAFWFVAIGLWRRDHVVAAVVVAALAQSGHAAVVLPLAGLTVLGRLPFEPRPRRLFIAYCASVLLASPAIVLVFISPVVQDSSLYSLAANFLGTVSLRAGVMFAPFAIILLDRRLPRPALLGVVLALVALNFLLIPIRHTGYAWHALARTPDTALVPFLQSSAFEPGATYRLLRVADGKMGMYQLIQHGGKLDSEFFPESIDRRSWPSAAGYAAFLRGRQVDDVIIYFNYDVRYQTNEHQLLDQLVGQGCATLRLRTATFDLYHLTGSCK